MEDGKHDDLLLGRAIEDRVGKPTQEHAPDFPVNDRIAVRRFIERLDRGVHGVSELGPQFGCTVVIPALCVNQFIARLGAKDEARRHPPRLGFLARFDRDRPFGGRGSEARTSLQGIAT